MLKYTRPSGSVIEVSDTDANREMAEKLGWTLGGSKGIIIGEEKPKRKRRTKAEMEADRASEESED